MEALEAVLEHWPVDLLQDVEPDVDFQVGRHAEDVPVECRVVQRAQRESVRHDRPPARMPVGQDMGRIEELLVSEPADRASLAVRLQDTHPEPTLMEANDRGACGVPPLALIGELQIGKRLRAG
jgi:hypothetical protein